MSQYVHLFQLQPLVTCRIREWASLGGRKTGSMYLTGMYCISMKMNGKNHYFIIAFFLPARLVSVCQSGKHALWQEKGYFDSRLAVCFFPRKTAHWWNASIETGILQLRQSLLVSLSNSLISRPLEFGNSRTSWPISSSGISIWNWSDQGSPESDGIFTGWRLISYDGDAA